MNLTKYLIILLVLLFPFGQLTRISLFKPEIIIYLHDFIILFILLLNLKIIFPILLKKQFLGFIIFSLCSLLFSLKILSSIQVLISSLYLLRFLSYISLFFVVKKNKIPNLQNYLLISIIVSLLFSFIQYFFFPVQELLFTLGWDRHYYRLTGTWLDANFTGLILILFILFIENSKLNKIPKLILMIISFLAVLLTYSRASYLTLIIIFFAKLVPKTKKSLILGTIIIFISLIIFLPKKYGEGTKLLRTSTIDSRIKNWQESFSLFTKSPIFGYGFNTLRYTRKYLGLTDEKWQTSHSISGSDNSLLFLLLTTGILGIFQFFVLTKYLKKEVTHKRLINLYYLAIFIHGMFTNSWFYPWVLIWFLLTI